jgi:hypothetical protein
LITLRIDPKRQYGVFDHRCRRLRGIAARSAELARAASLAHGTAMPAFLNGLTRALATDELALRRSIEARASRFLRAVRPDADDNTEMHTAKAFAVLYAVGRLAKDYGVLPTDWNCVVLMRRAYRMHQAFTPARRTFDDELLDLEDTPGTLKVDRQMERPSAKQIEAADVFVLVSGINRQIAIRQTAIHQVFRDCRGGERKLRCRLVLLRTWGMRPPNVPW